MKDRLRVFPMKALAAFSLIMGISPLSILLGRTSAPDTPALWLAPLFAALLWALAGYLLPVKGRLPFALLGCGLIAGLGVLFLWPVNPLRMLTLLPCMAALLLLPPAWGRPVWDEWPAGAWIGGIVLHLFGQFVSVWTEFDGVQPWLLPCFAVYCFMYVMCLNRHSLTDGMHGAAKAPAGIRRRNAALSVVFFLFALAAACWHRLSVWVGAAWDFIRHGIFAVIMFLTNLLPGQSMGGGGSGGDMGGLLGGMENQEPSPLAVFLEKVFQVVALILLLFLLALAVKTTYKGLKRLWKRLMEYLRRYAADSGEDYVDETESTVNWDQRSQTIRDQVLNVFRREKPERWESMNGRERVRYLYRQFLRRRPEAKNKTAREALSSDKGYSQTQARAFTEMYEQARYSDRYISEGEADALRKTIKG